MNTIADTKLPTSEQMPDLFGLIGSCEEFHNDLGTRWCHVCQRETDTTWQPMVTLSYVDGKAVYCPEDPAEAELNDPRCAECETDI